MKETLTPVEIEIIELNDDVVTCSNNNKPEPVVPVGPVGPAGPGGPGGGPGGPGHGPGHGPGRP